MELTLICIFALLVLVVLLIGVAIWLLGQRESLRVKNRDLDEVVGRLHKIIDDDLRNN